MNKKSRYTKIIALLALMIVAVFSLCACGSNNEWNRLESSECCNKNELSNINWDNINKSTAAYEEIKESLDFYSEDFGGVFIDNNGIYNICIVGSLTSAESDYLIYRRVENSYKLLEDITEEIGKTDYSVWMAGACYTCNKVMVCIETESEIPLLIKHLKSKNLYRSGALNFFVGANGIAWQ